ncbi:hypothetical protein PG999_012521 [Apiospora kogelbergensis]|uniref:Thaumatin family protein n=1 Tax=Apiospora kogelbergensis TaxID=1337665 RepID=A0AAW0QEZ6_9PEZI
MIALMFWFLTTLASTLVSDAALHPGGSSSNSHGMIFSPMQWSGNITVDGPIYKFNGTVQVRLYRDQKENGTQAACQTDFGFCTQEIHAQILKANPEFKLMDVSHKDSVKPHQLTINDIQCNTPHDGNWGYAIANEIQDGINYLRSLTGDCTATPGPCGRVSCSWNSGIGWCWNQPTGSYTTKCANLADYAQVVHDKCPYRPNEVWGEAYDDAGFSVWCAGMDHLC